MMSFQKFHQISRRACFKPIITEFIILKRIKQAERIVNTNCIFHKMVAIIALFQLSTSLFVGHFLGHCQFMQFCFQIRMNFLFGYSTQIHIRLTHRYVIQIIQITEYAYLTKFSDSRQHRKFNIPILTFQSPIKRL